MELVTKEEYIEFLGLKRPELDSEVEQALAAANSFVSNVLNVAAPESGYLEIRAARNKYFLDSPIITTIESIVGVETKQEISSDTYEYMGNGTIYFFKVPRPGLYKVTYGSIGIDGGIPADLKQAVCMLVDYWTKKEYMESRSFGGETVQSPSSVTGIPKHIRTIIELYRVL